MSINVLSAESHPLTALGIESLLRGCEGVNLVATVRQIGELPEIVSTNNFNVVVTGREAACEANGNAFRPLVKIILDDHPEVGVVLHSCIRNAAYVSTLAQLGVHAILDKEDIIDFLPAAISAAHAKASYISPTLADSTAPNLRGGADAKPLSRCEVNVMKSVLAGLSVKEISLTLFRSKQTISTHKKNAMRKLQVNSDAELFRVFSAPDFTLIEIGSACSSSWPS
ncbi:response regulator transcription factor [Caballeronia sp. ATUFL_F1_KS4A]|uniref:response regulator transcription factor n=1 Tax=Caballeronia sp. ATUFL_F1_KS4A TaxID=2921768 RepID=UPI0020278952|nr:response regulator transcription factor [Caballeronia sp. ATUFL_F1_KS4A]